MVKQGFCEDFSLSPESTPNFSRIAEEANRRHLSLAGIGKLVAEKSVPLSCSEGFEKYPFGDERRVPKLRCSDYVQNDDVRTVPGVYKITRHDDNAKCLAPACIACLEADAPSPFCTLRRRSIGNKCQLDKCESESDEAFGYDGPCDESDCEHIISIAKHRNMTVIGKPTACGSELSFQCSDSVFEMGKNVTKQFSFRNVTDLTENDFEDFKCMPKEDLRAISLTYSSALNHDQVNERLKNLAPNCWWIAPRPNSALWNIPLAEHAPYKAVQHKEFSSSIFLSDASCSVDGSRVFEDGGSANLVKFMKKRSFQIFEQGAKLPSKAGEDDSFPYWMVVVLVGLAIVAIAAIVAFLWQCKCKHNDRGPDGFVYMYE